MAGDVRVREPLVVFDVDGVLAVPADAPLVMRADIDPRHPALVRTSQLAALRDGARIVLVDDRWDSNMALRPGDDLVLVPRDWGRLANAIGGERVHAGVEVLREGLKEGLTEQIVNQADGPVQATEVRRGTSRGGQ